MRVLVIGRPKFQIPPEQVGPIIDGAIQWYERHKDEFEAFGTFIGGGGFGIVNAPDEEALNQLIVEMPFTPFSEVEVHPFVPGDTGFKQFQAAFAAMAGAQG